MALKSASVYTDEPSNRNTAKAPREEIKAEGLYQDDLTENGPVPETGTGKTV